MCGIVGVITKGKMGLSKPQEDTFKQLLAVDVVRGDDSTGIISVHRDSTFTIAKEAVSAHDFLDKALLTPVFQDVYIGGKAFIGHNRKSTVGSTNDNTAHPFVINNRFAMVHNGTLYQHRKLAETEVDSEALAIVFEKAFEQDDYLDALTTTLRDVNGAYACVMYDQRTNHIRLLRNKERPLAFVETAGSFLFASEPLMLAWIMARNNSPQADIQKIAMLPENQLLSIDLSNDTIKKESAEPKKAYTPRFTSVTHTKKSGGKTNITDISKWMSKRDFRNFRKQILGTRIQWWCDDYVEKNYPKTFAEGETEALLMGGYDEIVVDNIVHAHVDLKALKIDEKELTDALWVGTVENVCYSPQTGVVDIFVSNAVPLPFSVGRGQSHDKPKPTVIDAQYIKDKLDEQEVKRLSTLH